MLFHHRLWSRKAQWRVKFGALKSRKSRERWGLTHIPERSESPRRWLSGCRPRRCSPASWRWTERCSHSGKHSQIWGIPFWDQGPDVAFEQTHVGELAGRRSVVQQQVDDVCVPLLSSLMKGGVTVLQEGKRPVGLPVQAGTATTDASFLPLSLR